MTEQDQHDFVDDDAMHLDVDTSPNEGNSGIEVTDFGQTKQLASLPKQNLSRIEEPPIKGDTLFSLIFGATMSILAGTGAFAVVAAVVLAIIVPPWYRSLEPRYQVIWCNRVSLLCDLKPERETDDIYRLGADSTAIAQTANALLVSPTFTPTEIVWPTETPTPNNILSTDAVMPTAQPTHTPTYTPSPSSTPTPIPLPNQATLQLDNLKWEQQGWNNCGPTTITIGLTYFGYAQNQQRAVRFLKPNVEDTNVSPSQLVDFVNRDAGLELGVRALYRVGGTPRLLKLLVANEFPVIVERGIVEEEQGWMGHYSLVVGFDESSQEYLLFDSWYGYGRGSGLRLPMRVIEEGWQQFNYTFIVIFPAAREQELMVLLGDYADFDKSAQIAADIARQEVAQDQQDKWAWFNWGTSLTLLGKYQEAANAYDYARTLDLPFRMLWYQFGPYVAYYHVGRYDDVLALALASERTTPYVEEIYYYRGLVYAAQGKVDSAVFQFDRALQYNSNFTPAAEAKTAVLEGRFVPSQFS